VPRKKEADKTKDLSAGNFEEAFIHIWMSTKRLLSFAQVALIVCLVYWNGISVRCLLGLLEGNGLMERAKGSGSFVLGSHGFTGVDWVPYWLSRFVVLNTSLWRIEIPGCWSP